MSKEDKAKPVMSNALGDWFIRRSDTDGWVVEIFSGARLMETIPFHDDRNGAITYIEKMRKDPS